MDDVAANMFKDPLFGIRQQLCDHRNNTTEVFSYGEAVPVARLCTDCHLWILRDKVTGEEGYLLGGEWVSL